MFTFRDEKTFEEFEISGSTYEPIGNLFQNGRKVKGADFQSLEEMAVISIMCNDSAIDYNEYKNMFEKVGQLQKAEAIVVFIVVFAVAVVAVVMVVMVAVR